MTKPSPSLGRTLHFWPGNVYGAEPGDMWRWDGEEFQALQPGDPCLASDRTTWLRWDGTWWHRLRVDAGTLVTVTMNRQGLAWSDKVCIIDERFDRGGFTFAHCRPWPLDGTDAVEVPLELVTPLGRVLAPDDPSDAHDVERAADRT